MGGASKGKKIEKGRTLWLHSTCSVCVCVCACVYGCGYD